MERWGTGGARCGLITGNLVLVTVLGVNSNLHANLDGLEMQFFAVIELDSVHGAAKAGQLLLSDLLRFWVAVLDIQIGPQSAVFELAIKDLESQGKAGAIARFQSLEVRFNDVGKVGASWDRASRCRGFNGGGVKSEFCHDGLSVGIAVLYPARRDGFKQERRTVRIETRSSSAAYSAS